MITAPQRKMLLERISNRYRELRYPSRPKVPDPAPIAKARKLVNGYDAAQRKKRQAQESAYDKALRKLHTDALEAVSFGKDEMAALQAVRLFERIKLNGR